MKFDKSRWSHVNLDGDKPTGHCDIQKRVSVVKTILECVVKMYFLVEGRLTYGIEKRTDNYGVRGYY